MTVNPGYKHSELSAAIIGVFYEVYNELGYGFLESVYRKSLQIALLAKGLRVETEVAVPVFFRGKNVGDFRADMVVNGCVLLELKTAEAISIAHEAQLLSYLKATNLEVGLILNLIPRHKFAASPTTTPEKSSNLSMPESLKMNFLESVSSAFISGKVFQ